MGIEDIYWITPEFSVAVAGIVGLLVGSFLNVVIHRLPLMMQRQWEDEMQAMMAETAARQTPDGTGEASAVPADGVTMSRQEHPGTAASEAQAPAPAHAAGAPSPVPAGSAPRETFNLMVPRSRCPHCGHQITALENVPVLSWLCLRGKCRQCRTPIPVRYPAVELLTGVLAAASVWHLGFGITGIAAALFCCVLVSLTFIDFDTQLLPDSLTLPLLWGGLLLNLTSGAMAPLSDAVIGAMAGYLSLWSVYWLFKLLTGREGMGYGDFKLLAALGAWFGWQALPAIILMSSVIGAVVGVSLIVFRNHGRQQPIPFGPYLAGAGLAMLFFGGQVMALMGMGAPVSVMATGG